MAPLFVWLSEMRITTEEQWKNLVEHLDEQERKILFDALSAICPFPYHKGYVELWKTLSPEEKKEMQDNIRISSDGKIEMIKMKKKFSLLTEEHTGKDIFKGEHEDKN